MTRAVDLGAGAKAAAATVGIACCCLLAPRAPEIAFATAGFLAWTLASWFRSSTATLEISALPPRWMTVCLLLAAILAAKDLFPVAAPSGQEERQAALGTPVLAWPATARNPTFCAAASQASALLAGGAAALAVARAAANSAAFGAFVVTALAWFLTTFGAAVARNAIGGVEYGKHPVWVTGSKNGAATLIAIGVVLHLGLAARAWKRSRPAISIVHSAVAVALLSPLALLSSWTGLFALAAGTAVLLLPSGRGARGKGLVWLTAATAGAALMIGVAAVQPALVRRLADFGSDYRFQIWRDVATMVLREPLFGQGAGAFEFTYPLHGTLNLALDSRMVHPDSSWVLLLAEWGIAPLLLLGWLLWRLFRRRRDARVPIGPEDGIAPAWIARAGVAAWLVAGITHISLHRPEIFGTGMMLLGVMAGAGASGPRWRWEPAAGGIAAAAGLGLAVWSAGPGSNDLRWSLLDPGALWKVAVADGEEGARRPENVARLRAAVRLQHRAASYPYAVASLLHPASAEAALEYWRTAVLRAGDRGYDFLARAAQDFPETPPAYWLRLARETGPDNFLFIPSLTGVEAARELELWAGRTPAPLRPAVARQFLNVARRLKRPDLVERVAARPGETNPAFLEESARLLLEADRADAAWRALERRLPADEPGSPASAERPAAGLDAALAGGRFIELRTWVLSSPDAEARAALERICRRPDAPAWFHLRLARARAAAGDARGAAEAGLRGLAAQAAPR